MVRQKVRPKHKSIDISDTSTDSINTELSVINSGEDVSNLPLSKNNKTENDVLKALKNELQDFAISKIYIKPPDCQVYCEIGVIKLNVESFLPNKMKLCDYFSIYISESNDKSAIYFECCANCNKNGNCLCLSKEAYCIPVTYTFDQNVWKGLGCKRYFVCEMFMSTETAIILQFYLKKDGLTHLGNPSEYYSGYKYLRYVFNYFYNTPLKFNNNREDDIKVDLDIFYRTLKTFKTSSYVKNVQHPYLLPTLRNYQASAVNWMLQCENADKCEAGKVDLHPLYHEITTLDDKILYFNIFGGFVTDHKPSHVYLKNGGILADEMGLGKTVEALALIMCHERDDENTDKTNDSMIALDSTPVLESIESSASTVNDFKEPNLDQSISGPDRTEQVSVGDFDSDDFALKENDAECLEISTCGEKSKKVDDANCLVQSTIENVIVDFCWEGNNKSYKRSGSFKDFQKFVKRRKKDPFYMMSLRERLNMQYINTLKGYSARIQKPTIKEFFGTKVRKKSFFECVCGIQYSYSDENDRVQCSICTMWQHSECVNYEEDENASKYICPHCWVSEKPISSRATLIVCPSSILPQWQDEIKKHVKAKTLRVYVYPGVSRKKYVQPTDLANNDIVISSYEILRKELNYVDLMHSNSDEGRRLRLPKRFMATPSPLPCVNWWRICLDEAQMVERVSSRTAEMALRLSAVNRWCITGTPVQKSLNDLQGLLMFLGAEPYCVPQWWKQCLFEPFCVGDTQPLYEFMSRYMWRNSKKDVDEELDIPPLTEKIHWLTFNAVEKHFYDQLHKGCAADAIARINKFSDFSAPLSSLDRKTLSNLLQPLRKLRQACNHPQIVKGHFVGAERKRLSMEELLENLLKKAQLEAEEAHRIIVASWNGLAALDIINGNYVEAVSKYREILFSAEEYRDIFKTDSLQKLHTIHNLNEILSIKPDGVHPTLRDDGLVEEEKSLRDRYLKAYPLKTLEYRNECELNSKSVQELLEKMPCRKNNWWHFAIGALNHEFVTEVKDELLTQYNRFEENKCILAPVYSKGQLLNLLDKKMKELNSRRLEMISNIKALLELDLSDLHHKAIDCHLRPAEIDPTPCRLCNYHQIFEKYEEILFFVKNTARSRVTDRSKETQEMRNKLQMLDRTREGHWGQSELEKILKFLQTKSLGRVEDSIIEDAQTQLQVITAMKKEFKNFRILWRSVYDHISALDEVNMATIRFRLRLPGEELRPVVKKKEKQNISHELEKKTQALTYIFDAAELPQVEINLKSEKVISENELRTKLNHYHYLENLKKCNFGAQGGSNFELCPICRGTLGENWKVLSCGHSYCLDCVSVLLKRATTTLKCPVCRHCGKVKDISYVNLEKKKEAEVEEIQITGSLSTKIEGIVRLIIKIKTDDPEAKILVFSTWNNVIEIIAEALSLNGIIHRCLQNNFQASLSSFKTKDEVTVLLLPISSGAKGLNLTEARHLILVEPILNPANEKQAIGRIHRIGQTKTTFVHRFIIHDSIEERMFNVIHSKAFEAAEKDRDTVAIQDLFDLFNAETKDTAQLLGH